MGVNSEDVATRREYKTLDNDIHCRFSQQTVGLFSNKLISVYICVSMVISFKIIS